MSQSSCKEQRQLSETWHKISDHKIQHGKLTATGHMEVGQNIQQRNCQKYVRGEHYFPLVLLVQRAVQKTGLISTLARESLISKTVKNEVCSSPHSSRFPCHWERTRLGRGGGGGRHSYVLNEKFPIVTSVIFKKVSEIETDF